MQEAWLSGLKGQEREDFKEYLLNSKIVLDKLNKIVYNMYKGHELVTEADYDSPSWSHKQAHTNGYREALTKVLDLLDLNPKVTPNG